MALRVILAVSLLCVQIRQKCGEKRLVPDKSIPYTKDTAQLGADPLWEYVINTTSETKTSKIPNILNSITEAKQER